MKKSNTFLSFGTLALLLAGFLFASTNVAIAADGKPAADTKEVAADADKKHGDMKKKKKKAKDGEEEPECE